MSKHTHTQKKTRKTKKGGFLKKLLIILGSTILVGGVAAGVAVPLTLCKKDDGNKKGIITIDRQGFGNTIHAYYFIPNDDEKLVKLTATINKDKYKEEHILWKKVSGDKKIFVSQDGRVTWSTFFDDEKDSTLEVKAYLKNYPDVYDTATLNFHLSDSNTIITSQFGTDSVVFSKYNTPSNDVNKLRLHVNFDPTQNSNSSLNDSKYDIVNWEIYDESLKNRVFINQQTGLVTWLGVSKSDVEDNDNSITFTVQASLEFNPSISTTKKYTLKFGNPIPYPIEYGGSENSWFDINSDGVLTSTNSNWNSSELSNFDTLFIPSGVTKINSLVFGSNSIGGIPKITLTDAPNGINLVFGAGSKCTFIGSSAFHGCNGIVKTVVFPSKYENNISLGSSDYAFSNTGIETADLSNCDYLTKMPGYLFTNCVNLKNVLFPKKLSSFDYGCFFNCTSLNNVSLPAFYTTCDGIGPFSGCTSLTNLDTSKCKEIEKYPVNPREENFSDDLFSTKTFDGQKLYYDKSYKFCFGFKFTSSRTHVSSLVNIDHRTQIICSNAFKCNSSQGVYFNNFDISQCTSLKSIESGAFSGQNWLSDDSKSLSFPSSLEELGYSATFSNESFTTLDFTKCTHLTKIWAFVFSKAKNLTEIKFPKSLESLYCDNAGSSTRYPFQYCTNLKKINFTDLINLKSISPTMFFYCTSLDKDCIDLANCKNLYDITMDSFDSTSLYEENNIFYDKSKTICFGNLSGTSLSGELNLNLNTSVIAKKAFFYSSALSGITSVDLSKYSLFKYADRTSFQGIPKSALECIDNIYYDKSKTVCIWHADEISSINLQNTTKIICGEAFNYTNNVSGSLSLPSSITTIGERAFYNCSSLTGNINIPDSVEFIGNYCFYNCNQLSGIGHITENNKFSEIPENLFSQCKNLTGSINIPNNVKKIDESAFRNCEKLNSISFTNSLEYIGKFCFQNCSRLNILHLPNSIKAIDEYAFSGCSSIQYLDLSQCSKLTELSDFCFENCTSLDSLSIPANILRLKCLCFANVKIETLNLYWDKQTIENEEILGIIFLPEISLYGGVITASGTDKSLYMQHYFDRFDISYKMSSVTWSSR